jgi:GABA permease
MKNPLRSEEQAFRLVWQTIAYFAVIVLAYWINHWLGLVAFVVLTAGVGWWLFARKDTVEPPARQTPAASPPGEHRILVVANETVGGAPLLEEIRRRSEGVDEHVFVVVPALNSPLRHWTSDEDGAREAATKRLEDSLASLRASGVDARGEIGDSDPLQAIEDGIRTYAPDELIISTHPPERSHWLERGVVAGARERFALPVTHVVVDLGLPSVGSEPPGLQT